MLRTTFAFSFLLIFHLQIRTVFAGDRLTPSKAIDLFGRSEKSNLAFNSSKSLKEIDTGFVINKVSHMGINASTSVPLTITFSAPVDPGLLYLLTITSGGADKEPVGAEVARTNGKWSVSPDGKTVIFKPAKRWNPGMFFSLTIPESFRSKEGLPFLNGTDVLSFITDNGKAYGKSELRIDTMKMVNGNRIPLVMSLPKSPGKHPVLVFVHGGAWRGGTETESVATLPGGYFTDYLTHKLGVAIVAVGYRCLGSKGTFTKAKADISDAIRYVTAHADEYGFDLSRLGLCGESAGSPLSALIAQEDVQVSYYIGWNGLYDINDNPDSKFGGGNGFGQQHPSAGANSAIKHIRPNGPITLLLHGNQDRTINYLQSVRYHEAIKAAGGHSSLLIYDGQPHWSFYAPGGRYEISALFQVGLFLERVLRLN